MSDNNELSLRAASQASGVSKDTVWRAVRSGHLPAQSKKTGKGFHYSISRHALEEWCRIRTSDETHSDVASNASDVSSDTRSDSKSDASDSRRTEPETADPIESASVPLAAHLRTLDLSARLFEQLMATQAQLDRERDDKEKERRQADLLRTEIGAYKRALTESAESLAEQRALLLQEQALRQVTNEMEPSFQTDPAQYQSKLDLPVSNKSWGSRLKRWFGIRETG